MQVFDYNQRSKVLGDELAKGGEGTVYPLQERADVLVKKYHSEKLQKQRHQYAQKMAAMIELSDSVKGFSLAWPLLSVFDQEDDWIGYAMRRASGKSMRLLAHAMAYQEHFPGLTRRHIVAYLLSFLQTVDQLHQRKILVGDYNLNNFLCDPDSQTVTLIDCDSYQLHYKGKHYPCPVGSPDLTPVEHHGKNFNEVERTIESERFSIAIILFQCLMIGRHPYDSVGGEDPVKNLKSGNFAYGVAADARIPKGSWYNIWSHMPFRIKSLFIQVFREGVHDPEQRPTIAQWQEVLNLYLKEIKKGWHNDEIRPMQPKSKDYRGRDSFEIV